jgi:hypothetical protein
MDKEVILSREELDQAIPCALEHRVVLIRRKIAINPHAIPCAVFLQLCNLLFKR